MGVDSLDSSRDGLLARLQVRFHYHSGIPTDDVSSLALHTDKRVFNKQGIGFTSREEVASLLSAVDNCPSGVSECHGEGGVVTSLSYRDFLQLQQDLVGMRTDVSSAPAADKSDAGIGGFI